MDTPITISKRAKPARQTNHLTIGCLIFPRMDQIDFTGPFEVLSRNKLNHPCDRKNKISGPRYSGLILTPEMTIAEAPEFNALLYLAATDSKSYCWA
jgi:cyclohexyl-isocyanide hydratase